MASPGEGDSLLPTNTNGRSYGAGSRSRSRTPSSGSRTPSNTANAPSSRAPETATECDAARQNCSPAPGTYPVVGWDVTDTGGAGHHLSFRGSPWRLLLRDLRWVLGHLYMLPWLVLPATYDSGAGRRSGVLAVLAQVVMIPLSLVLTAAFLASAVVGMPPLVAVLAVLLVFLWVAEKAQGATTRVVTSDDAVGTDTEAWFFVNGVMTTNSGAEDIAARLHTLFRRPIVAVLNRSFGLWFDLLECMLQRDMLLTTSDIRVGYKTVRRAVLDRRRKRIVIIGHSQGGIITSAWADLLLTDVPAELLARVEVYTFASAANHFSRPAAEADGRGQTFAHVEHFANEYDFVAQFGVLGYASAPGTAMRAEKPDARWEPAAAQQPRDEEHADDGAESDADAEPVAPVQDPSTVAIKDKIERARPALSQWRGGELPNAIGDFGGRIFLRLNHSGHLLTSHYLNPEGSILDDPFVRDHSQLVAYLDGQNVKE